MDKNGPIIKEKKYQFFDKKSLFGEVSIYIAHIFAVSQRFAKSAQQIGSHELLEFFFLNTQFLLMLMIGISDDKSYCLETSHPKNALLTPRHKNWGFRKLNASWLQW